MVGILGDQTNHEKAIPYARRWLALDPLHEPAHRHLMLLYAKVGQHAAALRQYDQCRRMLENELGILPSQETEALYHDIQAGRVGDSTKRPRPRHNLPIQTTTFIGREAELANIRRPLIDEPGCRLLNLVGPGGIGKTRLALTTASQTLEAFTDGVYFVSLAPVAEAEDIVPAIAQALRFTFYGSTAPTDQLLDYLSQKQLLLVVDNLEHLLEGAGLLADILAQAREVTLLATSRERLNLQEEWVFEVEGLAFPTAKDEDSTVLAEYSAVELFTQRARQAAANFTPSAAEMAGIGRICQLVEGMPLGLELAAPWTKVLSCDEIAAEIERSLSFLATTLQNVPERHRSLRVVFEQTWRRLSDIEQAVLQRLSVFRGGCTREAAEQVTGATLPVLSALVDKALLRRTNLGRYDLHELIRQFAEERLQAAFQAAEQVQQHHQDYFIAFLEARTAGLEGPEQRETLAEIRADVDNVRLAWRRAVAWRDAAAIERSAECLLVYYTYGSGHYEGQVAFQQAVAAFTAVPDSPTDDVRQRDPIARDLIVLDQQENLVGFLLAGQAYFLARTSGRQVLPEQVIAQLLQAKPCDKCREAIALAIMCFAINYQGRSADSRPYAELALTLAKETGALLAEWWSLTAVGSPLVHSRPAQAEQFLKRALAVCQKSGDPSARGFNCQNLGRVCVELGKYREAARFLDQSLIIFEDLGNIQGLAYNFEDVGRLATTLGDYSEAIDSFRRALAYFDETRSALHAGHCRVWLGIALRLQGDLQQAEQTSQETFATFKAIDDPLHAGYCLLNLGCLAQEQGDLSRAERLQREALTTWQDAGWEARVADASRCLGHLMVALGRRRYGEARHYFRQALELATEHQMAPIALDICAGLAQLTVGTGELERAVEFLALAEQHEASTFATKQKARRQLVELVDRLDPVTAQAAQVRRQTQDLWATAQALLVELAGGEGPGRQ